MIHLAQKRARVYFIIQRCDRIEVDIKQISMQDIFHNKCMFRQTAIKALIESTHSDKIK